MGALLSHVGIVFMRMLAWLPLPAVRALGWAMGWGLYVLVGSRRRVVYKNLALCFPHQPIHERRVMVRQVFVCFAQAWLDRGWLWHASAAVVSKRLNFVGALHELEGSAPTLIFAPHFMGMDAGGCALMLNTPRKYTNLYRPSQ
jgi:Kdo2-lipid IVA lauroyltransferase/acyltransferase